MTSERTKVLVFGGTAEQWEIASKTLSEVYLPVRATVLADALEHLNEADVRGILVLQPSIDALRASCLIPQAAGLMAHLPDGVAVMDAHQRILWSNPRFDELASGQTSGHVSCRGRTFSEAFGCGTLCAADISPFQSAISSDGPIRSTLRLGEKTFLDVQATPHREEHDPTTALLIVTVRDISTEILQQKKLNAIYHAGLELGEIAPGDLQHMSVQDRVDLLKSKIIHYTKALLEFETVEIRLLDPTTKKLEPLLSFGMQPEAEQRELFAQPDGNGVTGFVAASGKSYLCEDTTTDPLYLPGAYQARSSLTVPLMRNEQVLGTFNVESQLPSAFNEQDLQFLELFSREVAVALNTLELLVAEKMSTVTESTERVLREVASPTDEVLNDATWILERYIGHDEEVTKRLQAIIEHVREVRLLIHRVGESISPKMANPPISKPQRPKLRGKRILVADDDESVRQTAHELLGRYGCQVETAHHGEEALLMVRRYQYDVVLADIRLPDMSGYECFVRILEYRPNVPVIFMTGFGYDPGHSIVKARQKGLQAVLYKPFRAHQLLDELEKALARPAQAVAVSPTDPASGSGTASAV
jgi:CheY-like chemotaxis protein